MRHRNIKLRLLFVLFSIVLIVLVVIGIYSAITRNSPSLSAQDSINSVYLISKEDKSLYKYDLVKNQLLRITDGEIDTYGIAADESFYFIKDGSLFVTQDGINITSIISEVQQPYSEFQKIEISPNLRYVLYGTIGEPLGSGITYRYWLVDINTKKTQEVPAHYTALLSNVVTAPKWHDSRLVFLTQDGYAIDNGEWEYVIADNEFKKYNPLELNDESWFNFSRGFSPNGEWVVYDLITDISLKKVSRNIFTGQTRELPDGVSVPFVWSKYSLDSKFMGSVNTEEVRNSEGKLIFKVKLLLLDLVKNKIVKTHHFDLMHPLTGFSLEEVSSNGFIYSLKYTNSGQYQITDTSTKTFTLDSWFRYLGKYNKNLYIEMNESIYLLDTETGSISEITTLTFPIEKAFIR